MVYVEKPKKPENSGLNFSMSGLAWVCCIVAVGCVIGTVVREFSRIGPHTVYDSGHRFKDDNATGATANAAELIRDKLNESPLFVYALIFVVIMQLERIRCAVVDAVPPDTQHEQ